jgi:hypothetical protein
MNKGPVKLHGFIYVLLRDHVPFGAMVSALEEAENGSRAKFGPAFNEIQMAGFAQSIALRLTDARGNPEEVPEQEDGIAPLEEVPEQEDGIAPLLDDLEDWIARAQFIYGGTPVVSVYSLRRALERLRNP